MDNKKKLALAKEAQRRKKLADYESNFELFSKEQIKILTKNSSLGVAIGYFDIVATIGTISLMQTGKEVETMVIVLSMYLCLSLIISGMMNLLNYRLKIKAR